MKKKKEIKLTDIFNDEARNITCGIEVEVYVAQYNKSNGSISYLHGSSGSRIMNDLLNKLPKNVWKDHYTYQLEIKTSPHDNVEDLLKDYKETFQKCVEVAYSMGLILLPISATNTGEQFNGLHFHVRNKGAKNQNYYNTLLNIYPQILSVASFFRDCPTGLNVLSKRISESRHIGLPLFDETEFLIGGSNHSETEERNNVSGTGERKYRDIIVNKNISKNFSNKRERSKTCDTLEIRMFDVPTKYIYFKSLIKILFKMFQHIKNDEPLLKKFWTFDEYIKLAKETREESIYVRRPHNYFYNCLTSEVIRKFCKYFEIDYPSEPFPIKRKATNIQCYNIFRNPLDLYKDYNFLNKDVVEKFKVSETKKNKNRIGLINGIFIERLRNGENISLRHILTQLNREYGFDELEISDYINAVTYAHNNGYITANQRDNILSAERINLVTE